MPPKFGRREQRPEIAAHRAAQEIAPKQETADEIAMREWRDKVKELDEQGAFDAAGRWASIPEGWSREQIAFAQKLKAEMIAEAQLSSEAINADEPTTEEADYMAGIEIGRVYPVEVNGEIQDLCYQGDDADGKAIMVTQKGMRLLKSKGLNEVKAMAEVFPNEFAVTVSKGELTEKQAAA